MLAAERRNQIMDILRREERVLVTPLAEHFHVSEETIRRDLAMLEQLGMAAKCYGGATLADNRNAPPFRIRKKLNVEEKKQIADAVAELISDGDHLMLDDSSTGYFVAKSLHGKKGLTVVTNSVEILMQLSGGHEEWNVISTGGQLDQNVFALFGRQAEDLVHSLHADKAIISCNGLNLDGVFSDAELSYASIKQAMIASSRETILLMDSHKFNRTAFASVGHLKDVSTVITDSDPGKEWRALLQGMNIRLIVANK